MEKTAISTKDAPPPLGAYVQAVRAGDLVFTSGQLPIDPALGRVAEDGIERQTRQVLLNIRAILTQAGGGLESAVKVTVYLKDLNDLKAMDKTYSELFGRSPTARMVFEAARLPRDVKVIMDAVACIRQ